MKYLLTILITTLCATTNLQAQKLVIGSTAPPLKEVKWLSNPPQPGKVYLIDFYQDSNPTCKQFFSKLKPLWQTYPDKIAIIILTRDDNDAIKELVKNFGDHYSFGYDATGGVFSSYGIKYLPSTLLTDSKGKILWMGNLGNLPQSTLDKL